MEYAKSLLENWSNREPAASLWLVVAAAFFFGAVFVRSRSNSDQAWEWGRALITSLARTLVFVAVPIIFYFLLNNDYAAFNKIYAAFTTGGSLSNQAWQKWRDQYGGEYHQQDLRVMQYTMTETQEAIQPADPTRPLLYRTIRVRQPVLQKSITRFRGQVTMNMIDSVHPTDTFNGYKLSTLYEYDVFNPTDTETHVEYRFPLSPQTKLYQDIHIKVNEEEIASYQVMSDAIAWDGRLEAGEKNIVSISFTTWGMDWFFYEILTPREVTDFRLTVVPDTDNCLLFAEPENGGIQLDVKTEPPNKLVTWTIERAILSPRMGISLRQYWPYAPRQEMIATLPYAGRALVLFLSLAMLTILICGAPPSLRQVALLACLFALPYLILMAGGIPTPSSVTPAQFARYQVNSLPIISIVPLLLALIALRKLERLPKVLILALLALFVAGYPFIGLLPDEQKRNAYEGMVQAAMIMYVFGLTLYIRLRAARATA